MASSQEPKKMRLELEKTGLNLQMLNQKLVWEPRGSTATRCGTRLPCPHRNTARSIDRAVLAGKSRDVPIECSLQESNLQPSVP